jgi:spore coat polysaccharide biosynthesis protein SpsF (cytidylyltransferase family)
MDFGDKSILSRIASQAVRVCGWFSNDPKINVAVAILVPYGDRIKDELSHKYTIIEGDEDDVASRYKKAMDFFESDYIVRITGDCVWLPSRIISKCIRDTLRCRADYCSNVIVRTFPEGYDCEVISTRLFEWMLSQDLTDDDKEHCTIRIFNSINNNTLPSNFNIHTVLNEYDMSSIKTSIDTKDEYDEAISLLNAYNKKRYEAARLGGVSI